MDTPELRPCATAAAAALPSRADLTTAEPSLGLDALYGVLCAVLAINAWSERQVLANRRQDGVTDATGGQQQPAAGAAQRHEGK